MPLLWKRDGTKQRLRKNIVPSKKRLTTLLDGYKSDTEKFHAYDDVIKDWERDGVIERCTTDPPAGKAHYLPHFAVVKKD